MAESFFSGSEQLFGSGQHCGGHNPGVRERIPLLPLSDLLFHRMHLHIPE